MKCEFIRAWIGKCGEEDCVAHKGLKCISCGEPATRECSFATSLVCGCELCDTCVHHSTRGHIAIPKPQSSDVEISKPYYRSDLSVYVVQVAQHDIELAVLIVPIHDIPKGRHTVAMAELMVKAYEGDQS